MSWIEKLSKTNRTKLHAMMEDRALGWPTYPDPQPVDFQWGAYDHLRGVVIPGTYWGSTFGYVEKVEIRRGTDRWEFRINDVNDLQRWTTNVVRGPLYTSKLDALRAMRWRKSRDSARELAVIDRLIEMEKDE